MPILKIIRSTDPRHILHVLLVFVAVLVFMNATSHKPPPPPPTTTTTTTTQPPLQVQKKWSTLAYRLAPDEVDCDHVFRQLRQLYRESKQRRAAWRAAGHPLTVLAAPGLNVTEMHLLANGDSWGERSSWAILRHLDMCRMGQATPLIPRHECAMHFVGGEAFYQIAKSALEWDPSDVEFNSTELVRIHIHYRVIRHLAYGARMLREALGTPYPTPGLHTKTFHPDLQCRQSLEQAIDGIEAQMPICLCEDTLELPGNTMHPVPLDSIQLFNGLWDTQIPLLEWNLYGFADPRVDWFQQLERFSPDTSVYPYITWEANMASLRRHLVDVYVMVIRRTVQSVVVREGVPMPRIMISIPPRVNCKSSKYDNFPTLKSRERCEELAWPVHKIVNDVVEAAYGAARMGLPHMPAPEWLRVADYRPLSVTESLLHGNNTGETIAPGEYICTMIDGAHVDTHTIRPPALPHERWCARHAHRLFWEQLR